MRWLAFFGCTLIALPPAVLAAGASQPPSAPAVSPQPASAELSAGTQAETLTASASGASQSQWAAPELWTAQDAISAPSRQQLDLESPSSAPVTPECRRPTSISSTWKCSIKPLARYDRPVRHALHHLWPLHGDRNGN